MSTVTISVPTAGVKISDNLTADQMKSKYKLSDEMYDDMAAAELSTRISGAVKRAIEGKKLPATPTNGEVKDFVKNWDGLGGRKGTPLTRLATLQRSDKIVSKEEMNKAIDEATDYLISQKSGSSTIPSA